MTPTIQVDRVELFDKPDETGHEGAVWYLSLHDPPPGTPEQCISECLTHPGKVHRYWRQGFHQGQFWRKEHALSWGWDGNREEPTLTPSFLSWSNIRDVPIRVHLFFRQGRIDLCSDSTVVVHPSPQPCKMEES